RRVVHRVEGVLDGRARAVVRLQIGFVAGEQEAALTGLGVEQRDLERADLPQRLADTTGPIAGQARSGHLSNGCPPTRGDRQRGESVTDRHLPVQQPASGHDKETYISCPAVD